MEKGGGVGCFGVTSESVDCKGGLYSTHYHVHCAVYTPEANSKVLDWWIKSTLIYRVKVDFGIGLPMVNVLESTLEWT